MIAISEIYDPSADQWTITGSLATPREFHTATLLNSGQVLVAGSGGYTGYTAKCEIYDPSTGQWHNAASMATPRGFHTATLLNSGQVLVTGGTTFNPRLVLWGPLGPTLQVFVSHYTTIYCFEPFVFRNL